MECKNKESFERVTFGVEFKNPTFKLVKMEDKILITWKPSFLMITSFFFAPSEFGWEIEEFIEECNKQTIQ